MIWTPYPTALPSFSEPIEPPAVEPDAGDLITATFSAEWLAVVEGALDQLVLQSTWKGTDDEIYVARRRATYLKELIATGGLDAVEPPYWEAPDGGDSEDTATADDQIWYGLWHSGVGFVDSLAGFVFSGFVALNFGAESAVRFATTLTRFRLAFRTRDTGAILRVLLDDDTFALVDTYSASPGVTSVPIASPGTTLIIQNTGTANDAATAVDGLYSMELIRMRLSPDDVAPSNIRYDPISDHFQRTTDGGATWRDSPDDDPRHSDLYRLPALSGTGHECDAAARIVAMWKETVDGFVSAINQYTFATSIIALIVEFLPGAGLLIDLALIAFDLLAAIGTADIEATFTDALWHDIQCIIECHLSPNGQMSATQMAAAFADIDRLHPGTAASTLHVIRGLYGEVFASNAGVERSEVGDCSDCVCGWCRAFDWSVGELGWGARYDSADAAYFAAYVAGQGWQYSNISGNYNCQFRHGFAAPAEIVDVQINMPLLSHDQIVGLWDWLDDGTITHLHDAVWDSGTGTWHWSGVQTFNNGMLFVFPYSTGFPGIFDLRAVTAQIQGDGDQPFGTDGVDCG